MTDYSSLKVPELKKLLAEKKLPQTGNKADLIARLQEDDKKHAGASKTKDDESVENKEDEITYSDDEPAAETSAPEPEGKPVEQIAEKPAEEEAAGASSANETGENPTEESIEQPAVEEKPKELAQSFAIGLPSSTTDEELKKRAERAKRFGVDVDEETKKLTDRAKRFGLNSAELAAGLDSALPERPLKRGRGRNEGDGNKSGKRRSQDRRGGGSERHNNRNRGNHNHQRGNAAAAEARLGSVVDDPTEKAKAERRAARFAAA